MFEYDKSIDGLSVCLTLGASGMFTQGTGCGLGTFGNRGILTLTLGGEGTDLLDLYGCLPLHGGGGGTL